MSGPDLSSGALLRLECVSVELGGRLIIHDLDLELARDRTTVLIGPSGCGKSTILRLAVGLERPTKGRVHFDGRVLDRESVIPARRRMGYVIQEGGLFPHLTAGDNVCLLARHLGWEATRIRERVQELCDLVRLSEDLLTRYPAQLSGGQRQRVGLMRALVLDPELLLLDEPLAALDPMVRAELQEDLRSAIQDRGKACVLVTHDMGEAAFFADDVVLLRAGEIVQRGAVRDLVESPAEDFVAEFVRAQRSPLEAWL